LTIQIEEKQNRVDITYTKDVEYFDDTFVMVTTKEVPNVTIKNDTNHMLCLYEGYILLTPYNSELRPSAKSINYNTLEYFEWVGRLNADRS